MKRDWRFALLGGATAGIAASPLAGASPSRPAAAAAMTGLALAAIASRPPGRAARGWFCTLAGLGALAGLIEGTERLAAIDRGAMEGRDEARLSVTGTVAAVPRRAHGQVRVRVDSPAGRVLVQAREPVPDLPVGAELSAEGRLTSPSDAYAGYLRRYGISRVLVASRAHLTGARRGGFAGAVDSVRTRAEAALGRSVPGPEAALARGFVLGEDDRIDEATVTDFKRSGLAHLLAVSGENVLLLALLAMPLLALTGLGLQGRLVCVLGLIALYVPVTGAGPSIQRAGVMGAAAVVAALAGRRRSRAYAVLLAALVTLALNPRSSGDPGWQLSFAAVLGIMVWTTPFAAMLSRVVRWRGRLARVLIEGAAVTVAAALATAPLMSHDFGAVPAATLPANLLALPAVAPAMWLGMLASICGQLPVLPVEPLNWLDSLLLAYIAAVAHVCAAPDWALLDLRLRTWPAVGAAYGAIAATVWLTGSLARRRERLGARPGLRRWAAVIAAAAALAAVALPGLPGTSARPAAPPGLRMEVLNVGQGDAILLEPGDGLPVLVDGGPHGDGLAGILAREGVGRLAAVAVTHDQADHAGGIEDALGALRVGVLLYGEPSPELLGRAAAAGVRTLRVSEGSEIRSGSLRLEVLWPPRGEAASSGADPNAAALVLLARWRSFSALLTADAEAELAPVDPGPVDVLKVAHHGSADAGLSGLLERTAPRLAVVSVGEGNPYGHPAPETLAALRAHGVPLLRTDRDGAVRIDARPRGWAVTAGH
jgi:competence protein ComEC